MRKLTAFEIASVEFKTQLTSMNVEGIGEGGKIYVHNRTSKNIILL